MKRLLFGCAITLIGLVSVCASQVANPGILPTGTITANHCVKFGDASGYKVQDSGGACGAGTTTGPAGPTTATDIVTSTGTANQVQDPGSCTLTSSSLTCPSGVNFSMSNNGTANSIGWPSEAFYSNATRDLRLQQSGVDKFQWLNGPYVLDQTTGVIQFGSSGLASPDLGLSRISPNTLGIGTSAQGNTGGNFSAANGVLSGTLTSVSGIATTGNGISLTVAKVGPSTAQAAAIGTTTLYTVPGSGSTFSNYRLFAYVVLTQQATTSEIIGPLTVTYNDGTGARSITIGVGAVSPSTGVGSSTAITSNLLGGYFSGILPFMAQGGTNITYSLPYTSVGGTPAQYTIAISLDTF